MTQTTHLEDLYAEHGRLTNDPKSPYYRMDPQQFAQKMQSMGVTRYDMLNENKFVRGLQIVGDSADRLGNAIGANDALGGLFRATAGLFTENEQTLEASEHAGREMFGMVPSLLSLATVPFTGPIGLAGAIGLAGLDAYTDSREGGLSRGTSLGIGAISGGLMGLMPMTGALGQRIGTRLTTTAAERTLLDAGLKTGATGLRGTLQSAVPYATREFAQFGLGTAGDIGTNLIDPNQSLADLQKEEYLIPMLLGNSIFVVGDLAIVKPAQALRRKTVAPLGEAAVLDAEATARKSYFEKFGMDENTKVAELPSDRFVYPDSLYDDVVNKNLFDANTDAELASRFKSIEEAEAQISIVTGDQPGLANYVDRFVTAAEATGIPYERLKAQALSTFKLFGNDPKLRHRAIRRILSVAENDAKKTYKDFPDNLKDTPLMRKIYASQRERIKSGDSHVIYHDEADSITALKVNDRIVVYKGDRVVQPNELEIIGKHRDGIDIGEVELETDLSMIRNHAITEGGVAKSRSIPENVRQGVSDILKGLNIDTPVFLSTFSDAKNDPTLRPVRRYAADENELFGRVHYDPNREFGVIYLRDIRENGTSHQVLMHELGHIIERHYAKNNPTALAEVKAIHEKFGKGNFRKTGALVPELQRKAKQFDFQENSFQEWFANQFARYMADPSAKTNTVTDTYFASMVKALRQLWEKVKAQFRNPEKHYKQWMESQMRRFYANIVGENDPLFKRMATEFSLDDATIDQLGRALYTTRDPRFHTLLEQRLEQWHARGRNIKPDAIIAKALGDYYAAPDILRLEGGKAAIQLGTKRTLPRPGYTQEAVAHRMFGDHTNYPLPFLKRLSQKINSHVDQVDGMVIAQHVFLRWTAGELPKQTKPRQGGFDLLEKTIYNELHRHSSIQNTSAVWKKNKTFGEGEPMRFADEMGAREVASQLNLSPDVAGRFVQVLRDGDGWIIKTTFDEQLARVDFDERFKNQEMDDKLLRWQADRFWSVAESEQLTAGEKRAGLLFDMRIPQDTAQRVTARARVGKVQEGVTADEFKLMLNENSLPDYMIADIGKLRKALKDPQTFEMLHAVGAEFGWKGDNLNDFLATYAEKLASGKTNKNLALFASDPIQTVMRDVAEVMGDMTKLEEFGARIGSLAGESDQLEHYISRRYAVERIMDADASVEQMAEIVKNASPGGLVDSVIKQTRGKGVVGKAFDAVAGNIMHLAARHPQLRPLSEAIMLESRDQHALSIKLSMLYHADDIETFIRDPKADDVSKAVIQQRPELRAKMSDISRISNVKGETVVKLIQDGDPEITERWGNFTDEEKGLAMKMFQRSYNVQKARAEMTETFLREIDDIQLATFINLTNKQINPRAALAMVDVLSRTDPTKWIDTLVGGGLTNEQAMSFVKKKVEAGQLTDSIIKRMKAHPEFISEQRFGRYHVRYTTNVDGKAETGLSDFDTYEAAQKFIDDNPQLKISDKGIEDTDTYVKGSSKDVRQVLDSSIESKKSMLQELFGEDAEILKQMQNMLDDVFSSVDSEVGNMAKKVLGQSRDFKPGRENMDMFTQQMLSVQRSIIGLTRARTNAIFRLFKNDQGFQIEGGSRLLRKAEKSLSNLRTKDTEAGRFITKLGFGYHMGFNASSMIQELMGIPFVVGPMAREAGLGLVDSFKIPAKTIKELGQAALNKNYKWDNPDHADILHRASEEGLLTQRMVLEQDEAIVQNDVAMKQMLEGRNKLITGNPFSVYYKLAGKIYSQANKVSATATLITGYEAARKANPKGTKEQWYQSAVDFHARTNGAGGRASRLIDMPTGTLGQAAWSLQSFAHTTIANWVRWIDDGYLQGLKKDSKVPKAQRQAARKAANQAIAMTSTFMGVMGFPAMGALNAIIKNLTGIDPEREMEQWLLDDDDPQSNSHIVNFALRGLMYSSGLPFDLQSRMAVGGVFAANAYDGFNAGQMFGSIGSLIDSSRASLGHIKKGDMANGVASLMPTGIKRSAQLWAGDGQYKRDGEVILDPTAAETVMSILGFSPQRMRQRYELVDARNYFATQESEQKQAVQKQAVTYLQSGEHQKAQKYLQEQALKLATNKNPKRVYQGLVRGTASMYARNGQVSQPDVGTTEQAAGIQALFGNKNPANLTELYLREQSAKQLLGSRNRIDPATVRRKMFVDQAVNQNPDLNQHLLEGLMGMGQEPFGLHSLYQQGNTGPIRPTYSPLFGQ